MKIDFVGLNSYVIEPRFMEYTKPRLEGLLQFTDRLRDVRVAVEMQRGRYTVEITCDVNGLMLRSETTQNDLLGAFDEAQDKIERQLTRYKSKLVRRRKQGPHRGEERLPEPLTASTMPDEEEEELEEFDIVRTKSHALKPMSPQEAVLQMELLGHDFYVFLDDEADTVGVVYRRRSGGYGLIEPEVDGGAEEEE